MKKKIKRVSQPKVLDSWAVLAYFEGARGGEAVLELLKQAEKETLWMTSINWGEVLYMTHRRYGEEKKDLVEHLLEQMPLEIVGVDKALTRQAAYFKAVDRLPYCDSFAAALACLKKAELVTGDKDFKLVEDKVKIHWLI